MATAYRETKYGNDVPADLVPSTISSYFPFNEGRLTTIKFSREGHLASPTGGFCEYLVGGFYNKLNAQQSQIQWASLGAPLISATGVRLPTLYGFTGANDPVTGKLLGCSTRTTKPPQCSA